MARPHPALIEIAAGRPAPSRVDHPERLLASAFDHRMQGLLWSAVLKDEIVLPSRAELELAALDLDIQARHQRLWAILEEVTTILAAKEIQVATFKGVAAEARWYDRIGERPTQDVDLWLSPHQLHRVEEAVQLLQPGHPLAGKLQSLTEREHLQSIDVTIGDVGVDLHVDPFKLGVPFRGLQEIWGRRVDVQPGITMLDPAASLAQFLLHLNKDRFSWLLGLADIGRILEKETNPGDEAMRIADAEGFSVPLAKSMELVQSVLGPAAESPFPPASGWRSRAWDRVWTRGIILKGDHGILKAYRRQNLLPFLARGRVVEAVRFIWRTIFRSGALLDDFYPDVSGPYFVRLARGRARRVIERRHLIRQVDLEEPD